MRTGGAFMSHKIRATVLLIEPDTSLRRLIALGLQSRNMHVIEASSPAHLPPGEAPDLLILDVDGRASSDHSLLTDVYAHPQLSTLPIMLLAWECPVLVGTACEQEGIAQAYATNVTCLAKPFDARALHMTIEQLLAANMLQQTEYAQAVLLPARPSSSAPSIWPFVTAAGLLVAFIGLLGLLAFTALGLCIVVAALLWWTSGTKSKQEHVLPISSPQRSFRLL